MQRIMARAARSALLMGLACAGLPFLEPCCGCQPAPT